MKLLILLLAFGPMCFGDESTFHIKAAANAYEQGKEALRAKQSEKAIDLLHEAIRIEPTFKEAFEGLAGAYLDAGHQLEAAAVLTQLIEFAPEATDDRLILGQILLKAQQPQRALAQFSLVLNRDQFNAEALLGFASAARQTGLSGRASEAMERGRRRYPSDARFKTSTTE
jgi:tetratricopeptide (TPR) repeat protein